MEAHIYAISRLYKQDAAHWEVMLRTLEEERKFRFFAYKPLREAIVREMRHPGSGHPHLVSTFAATPPVNKQEEATRAKSFPALDTFISDIRPKLGDLSQNFLGPRQPTCHWQGHDLAGGFHFSALPKKGKEVFLYLSASAYDDEREKDIQQRKAIIGLLHIIAEHRFSAESHRVWFVDLQDGSIHKPSKSVVRLRKDFKATLDHLARLTTPGPTP